MGRMAANSVIKLGATRLLAVLALCLCFAQSNAWADASGCPKKRGKLDESKIRSKCSSAKDKEACNKCADAIKDQDKQMQSYDEAKKACEQNQKDCSSSIQAAKACQAMSDPAKQTACFGDAQSDASMGKGCLLYNQGQGEIAGKAADQCKSSIKSSCQDESVKSEAEKEAKKCDDAGKDAKQTAKDQGDKAKQAGDQADKNKNNDNKMGGGMPQMPQMPQQQGDQGNQDQATSPTPNSENTATAASSTAPGVETNKFTDPLTANGVAFGGSSTNTNTSTLKTDGPSFGSGGNFNSKDGLGFNSGSGVGSGGSPLGGALGGGGSLGAGGGIGAGTLAHDATGPDGKTDPNASNPYEINAGGGGKLGAPKGFKGGGDSDASIADAAKTEFKGDFTAGDGKGKDVASTNGNPEDDPDGGYTVFKMVKTRYQELKKRGSI
jgi:hypothetical protein